MRKFRLIETGIRKERLDSAFTKQTHLKIGFEFNESKNEKLIEDILTGDIVYTNKGIYLINNPSQVWSAVDNTITISGLDLMAKLTGLRNGNLEGLEHIIPQGSNVRDSIIATLELASWVDAEFSSAIAAKDSVLS